MQEAKISAQWNIDGRILPQKRAYPALKCCLDAVFPPLDRKRTRLPAPAMPPGGRE